MTDRLPASRINPIPPAARPLQGLRAGVVSRTLAGGIDYLVVIALTVGTYVSIFVLKFLIDPRNYNQLPSMPPILWLAVGFSFMVLYLWLSFATTGRTVGARIMGLRVVGRKGRRLPWWSALLRSLFCAAFPIGLWWSAISHENRSVQDLVLRTSVIHHWPEPPVVSDLSDVDHRSDL
jgi:uncharacterized RDD family membrane protein YckC